MPKLKRFLCAAVLLCAPLASAQSSSLPQWQIAAGGKMSFEVASIRPAEPGKFTPPTFALDAGDAYSNPTGNVFKAGFSLETYIEFAYKLWLSKDQRDAMLANQPKWVASEQFVIDARAAGTPTKDQMRLMLQSLLAERFHLQLHFEKRDASVLALTLIKPGKTGPNLRPHSQGPSCDTPWIPPAKGTAPDTTMFPPSCNTFTLFSSSPNTVLMGSRDTSMNLIAANFSGVGHLDRTIVDQTGLPGKLDFRMEWTPEQNNPSSPNATTETAPSGTTFLEAMKEQLGLQLKSTHAPVDTPVIDHVELPSEN